MKKKDKKKLMYFSLFNDTNNKALTTFKNRYGDSLLLVILPTDFDEWENVNITYYKK